MLCRKSLYWVVFAMMVMLPVSVQASAVDEHAPIGVMGDHLHHQGKWMASYRYMRMDMPQMYSGSTKMTTEDVLDEYMISPVNMTMEMHMVGLMYGATEDVTAVLMVPYVIKDMEHRRRDDRQFSASAQGIGDVRLSGLFSLKRITEWPIHVSLGLSLPTGSINRTDETLMGKDQNLPYPMQLGSGTLAVVPGVTYFDKYEAWSWGAQGQSTIQLGKNAQKYQVGDRHELTAWLGYRWAEWISSSIRTRGSKWGNVNGVDQRLNPMMTPTADPNNQAGQRIDMFLGVNLLGLDGWVEGHRLALELGYPVYQHLSGPQLGVGFQGTVGWQKAF